MREAEVRLDHAHTEAFAHRVGLQGFQFADRTVRIGDTIGSVDTLCDDLAESISKEYSKYCLENFGHILPHMVDKIGLIGGLSNARFGEGEIVKPVTLLLNGRFSKNLGKINIPYYDIIKDTYTIFTEFCDSEDI